MKLLKKLLTLLIFIVACVFVLGALQDWFIHRNNAENPFGRGVRKLSAVNAVNSTEESKRITMQQKVTTIPPTTAEVPKMTSKPITVPAAVRRVLVTATTKKLHALRSNFGSFKLDRNAAHLLVSNSVLKTRTMKIVKKQDVKRILLVTYFRGGSTFLGDVLQQNWKTFYHFEPLHYMSTSSRINSAKTTEAFNLLSLLFRCNFDPLTRYTKWAMIKKHQFLFKRNLFLWSLCHIHPTTCFTPHFLREICLRAPVQVMKVTRLHLEDAVKFIETNRGLKIQLIYLTRDPRGIISSRRVLDWCQKDGCDSPEKLCKDMSADAKQLKDNSESFKWLRYEDVCLNPRNVTRNLYEWIGVPYTVGVANFLRSHTNATKAYAMDPYSTRRNTTTVAFDWLNRLSFSAINHIQYQCKDAMRTLKYKAVSNSSYGHSEGPEAVLETVL